MEKKSLLLSKSKFMDGLQCLKLLWYEYNRKDEIPLVDAAQQAIFEVGHKVGELAHQIFPSGIFLDRETGIEQHLQASLEALKLRKPLFEAGFSYKNTYALVDILVPADKNEWDLIEVKSSTSVKEEYLYDVAFQKYVYEGANIQIRNCFLMYINNKYVRKGEIEIDKLFVKENITEKIENFKKDIEKNVKSMMQIIFNKMPDVKIG